MILYMSPFCTNCHSSQTQRRLWPIFLTKELDSLWFLFPFRDLSPFFHGTLQPCRDFYSYLTLKAKQPEENQTWAWCHWLSTSLIQNLGLNCRRTLRLMRFFVLPSLIRLISNWITWLIWLVMETNTGHSAIVIHRYTGVDEQTKLVEEPRVRSR